MKRKFLLNLAFLILVNLLVKPFWIFGIDRTVQNLVGTGTYGAYFAIFNFSFLFHIILDFGINAFNNRAVARHESLVKHLLPNIFIAKFLLAVLYLLVTFAIARLVGFSGFSLHLLAFLALNQILISFILYFRSNISALHHFRLDALLSVTDKVLMIAILSVMIWGGYPGQPFRIEWLVYGQSIAYGVTTVLAFGAVRWKAGSLSFRWDYRLFKRVLRYALPFATLGLLMSIYNRIDGVMLERMLGNDGPQEAGIYAASYRILDAVNMAGFAFATILLPMFSRMLKKQIPIRGLLRVSYGNILVLSISIASFCVVFAGPVMHLLYHEADAYWARVFSWLMICFPGVSTMYIFGTLLTAAGELKKMNILALSGVVVNIALNAMLIPGYGALGATVATLVTQWGIALVQVTLVIYLFRLRTPFMRVFPLVSGLVLIPVLFYLSSFLPVHWFIAAAAGFAASLLLGFLTGILRIKDWLDQPARA